MDNSRPLSVITVNSKYVHNKFCQWLDFELQTSVLGSDHFANWAPTNVSWSLFSSFQQFLCKIAATSMEPRSSVAGSQCSANCSTATAQPEIKFALYFGSQLGTFHSFTEFWVTFAVAKTWPIINEIDKVANRFYSFDPISKPWPTAMLCLVHALLVVSPFSNNTYELWRDTFVLNCNKFGHHLRVKSYFGISGSSRFGKILPS